MQSQSDWWLALSSQWRFISEKWSYGETHRQEMEKGRQRDVERQMEKETLKLWWQLCPKITSLEIHSYVNNSISLLVQTVFEWKFCDLNSQNPNTVTQQQYEAGTRPSWISGSAKDASLSIFSLKCKHSQICKETTSIPYLFTNAW